MPLISSEPAPDLVLRWALAAPADRVWRHLTDRGRLPEWLGKTVETGGSMAASIMIDHGDGYICESRFLRFEPEARHGRFSWKFPDEHETFVSAIVLIESESSVLVLKHEGLAGLRESYESGWVAHLTYFEASLQGTPLPWAQFWNLHGTVSVLLKLQVSAPPC